MFGLKTLFGILTGWWLCVFDVDERERIELEAMDRDENARIMAALERAKVETRERVAGER